tara:strand:- start:276 stop:1082 length:807 start_codon:yes stop_codon:yes gene_type:complete
MKALLTISAFVLSTIAFSQSKKEFKAAFFEAQQNVKTYKSLANTWKDKSDTWKDKYEGLNEQNLRLNKKLNDLTDQLITILPHLIVSEGFPETFYPYRDNIDLYNEVNAKGYERGDTTISSKYNCAYFPLSNPGEPDSVIILGIIDSTLSRNSSGVMFGSLPVLYDNKIRYTSIRDLKGSEASRKVISVYEKKILTEKYGEELGSKIYYGRPWIGMSFDVLYEMFGVHDDFDSYETSFGKTYTYTYRSSYETFVITVQNRKVTEILKL